MSNIEICFDLSGVKIFMLKRLLDDEKLKVLEGQFVDRFPLVVDYDADVFDETGKMLLRFRKNVLDKKKAEDARVALQNYVENSTDRRTISSGDKGKKRSKPVKSNIIGFMDSHSIAEIHSAKINKRVPPDAKLPRLCAWNRKNPDNFNKVIPYIEAIDEQYKRLCPTEYESQREAAEFCDSYRISKTAFSTVTINKNYRTACHYDKGDWTKGFGNLTVFEKGKYEGGITGFPEYGIGVDVRSGDFLAMNVHKLHCNTPIIGEGDFERISFVSYLREGIFKKLTKFRNA